MADLGVEMTDKRVDEIKERLLSAYKEAASDLRKKAEEHTKRFEGKDERKRADRDSGKLSEEDYQKWLKGQVFIGKQWQSKVDQMARMLTNAERVAVQIVHDGQMATFADNANYTEYCIDKDTGFGVNFSLYDESTVMLLLQDQPELMPRRVVDDEKCEAWNQKVIANCITQGIIQGESIPQIAKRMARDTASTDMKAMVRYARTAMTGAQNSGRIYAMEKSIEQGVEVKKVWIATLDERTRDAHLDLDGQIQDVKEPFDSELGPIMYPGDPSADEANVWNCRCTLGYEYPDSPSKGQRYDQEFGEDIDDMSFDEWFEWRKGQIKERYADLPLVTSHNTSPIQGVYTSLSPYSLDYDDFDKFLYDANTFNGERTQYIEDIRPNTEVRFANPKWAYGDEPYCAASRVDNAIARFQEKVPLLEEKDKLIICDYKNAWSELPKGKDDRRYHEEMPIAQVFQNEGQIVIAVNRGYMNGTVEQSIMERERILSNGGVLPNVFPIETPETVIAHEWGHTIYDYYSHGLVYDDENAKGLFEWWRSLTKEEIETGLSEYATTNFGEFCAECFAELQAPNPRPLAEQYWGYMEPLIEKRYRYE